MTIPTPEASRPPARFSEEEDNQLGQYRRLSGLAVAAVLFGILSPLALTAPALWLLPAAALLLSVVALLVIRRNAPWMTGRRAALAGLALAVVFGTAAPTDYLLFRWQLRREARQVAQTWFEYLRQDEPMKAHQLELHAGERQPLDENLITYYRKERRNHSQLHAFANDPLVRTLLALGPRSQVRYFTTEEQGRDGANETLRQVYAVTYDEGGQPTTFFVAVTLERTYVEKARQADWRLVHAEGGYHPRLLK